MKKILTLSHFNIKSLLKQKTTWVLLILSVICLGFSQLVSGVNIAKKHKLFEDILLTSQMALLHLSAIFYTFEFLQKERLGGLFIVPLSTSLNRKSYFVATFFTFLQLSLGLFLVFALTDAIFLLTVEGHINFMVLWQLFLFALSSILLAFFVICFAQFVSIMNSVIYAVVVFVIGGSLDELYIYGVYFSDNETFKLIAHTLYYMFPNFSLFDIQSQVVNNALVLDKNTLFLTPVLYFLGVSLVVFVVGVKKFNKRMLKIGE